MMIVKLKTKIALGGIFLFTLLILVGAVSFFYLNNISLKAKDIIKDNYETLNYTREMLLPWTIPVLIPLPGIFLKRIFCLQEKNITEPEEKALTASLRKSFNALEPGENYDSLKKLIRQNIGDIMEINLKAIDTKNKSAMESADSAKFIITIILTLCILAGLTFIFNFPSLVASPIASLTKGIRAIAEKDYRQRIHLNRKDEFGELANAFNTMAEKLDEYEHSNLSKILFEKQRAETVINY